MSKLLFKIDKDIDFQNHLIQVRWRFKAGAVFDEEGEKYMDSLENSENKEEQREKFEKYSSDFYSEKNKENVKEIITYLQNSWNEIEDIYLKKMERIHKKEFPYEKVFGVLSTTPWGWGINLRGDSPWFACPNKKSSRAIKIAMHEIMHGFFQKYFLEDVKKKFNLNMDEIWTVQESLTVLLNVELYEILPELDMGYLPHQELREKISQIWIKTNDLDKVLEYLCNTIKKNPKIYQYWYKRQKSY